MHRQIEIMYILNGSCTIFLSQQTYELHKGNYIVLKPFELHDYASKRFLKLSFASPIFPTYISDRLIGKIDKSEVFYDETGDIGKFINTFNLFDKMSGNNRFLFFEVLEKMIIKNFEPNNAEETKIIDYIKLNTHLQLTLQSIASACCSNRCTVSKLINNYSGQNLNNYVNKLRLGEFLEICSMDKDIGIEKTAQKVGFNASRTFYRAFYKEFNMTPTQYLEKLSDK